MDIFGKERIAEIERRIQQKQSEVTALIAQAQVFVNYGRQQADELQSYNASLLDQDLAAIREVIESLPFETAAGWDDPRWNSWQPEAALDETRIRIGDLLDSRFVDTVITPAYAPFIGQNRTVIIRTSGATAARGAALLQSLVIRTALLFPHQTRYTLLDPAGNGINFPMQARLPLVRPHGADTRRELDDVIDDIRRILQTVLGPTIGSFELIPEEQRVNERYQFVFAADFPNQYSHAAIDALASVGNTGPKAGVYLFIHYNQDQPLPRGLTLDAFRNAYFIDLEEPQSLLGEPFVLPLSYRLRGHIEGEPQSSREEPFVLQSDRAPLPGLQDTLLTSLAQAKPPERIIDWDSVAGLPESKWWNGDATETIETPIGAFSNGTAMRLWFGVDQTGRACVHGVLGGMPGTGKSTLYHDIICGLSVRYSPSELRFYLIDGKYGVEFQPYRRLPHAEVVSLYTPPELARSVLADLKGEMDRRFELFGNSHVEGLGGYRRNGGAEETLPRIVLLVDEYQTLFEGDRDGSASSNLLEIARQGRAAGIHMFLGSQGFGTPGMLNRDRIFENVHLRVAMQMTGSAVQALTEFERGGKVMIATCDLPGKLVINDDTGRDPNSRAGKAALLRSDRRDEIVQRLQELEESLPITSLPQRVVFNGQEQPLLLDNPVFSTLLRRSAWPTPQELQEFARTPVADGGLGIATWFAAEHPTVVWLGQEFTVRGQAHVILRRSTAENITLVGSENATRFGMAASMLESLAINLNPDYLRFAIADRSIPDTPWSTILSNVADNVLRPAGFDVTFATESDEVLALLDRLCDELDRRQKLDERQRSVEPSLFVLLSDPDHVDALCRHSNSYGPSDSEHGKFLARIFIEGPRLGIHVILSFGSFAALEAVVDRQRGLPSFQHRIALQMSDQDAFKYTGRREPSELNVREKTPINAVYFNVRENSALRFKPYSIEPPRSSPEDTFDGQLNIIGAELTNRRTAP